MRCQVGRVRGELSAAKSEAAAAKADNIALVERLRWAPEGEARERNKK